MTNADVVTQHAVTAKYQPGSRLEKAALIKAEQARILFSQVGASLFASVANASLVVLVLWHTAPLPVLLGWLAFMFTVTGLRYRLLQVYRKEQAQRTGEAWIRLFAIGAGAAGMTWGIGGLALTPLDSLLHQMFIAFVLAGMAVGGIPYLSIVSSIYRLFMLSALLPLCGLMIYQFDSLHLAMGLMGLLFIIMMLYTSQRLHRDMYDALSLRFDYRELIRDIGQVKSRLLLTNLDLQNEIEERKHAEQVLRESEERTRRLSEAAFEGIVIHDHGVILDANQTFAEMFGCHMDELIGSSVLSLIAPESHERAMQSIMQRPSEVYELMAKHCDGHEFQVELRGRDMPRGDRTVRVVVVRDISEQKAAEQRVLSSERKLAAILDNVQDMLYQTDADNILTWVTPSASCLLGMRVEEVCGHHHRYLFAEPEAMTQLLRELAVAGGSLSGYETQFRRQDGSTVWVSLNAHYYTDAEGQHCGVECAARDITALKQAELALHEEKERAQVTLDSIGDGVITTDMHGRVKFMNPVAEELTGWELHTAGGRPMHDILWLIDEDTGQRLDNPIDACLESDSGVCLSGQTLLLPRFSDQRYSIEVTSSQLRDRDGRVIGAVLVLRDVTALRGMAMQMSYQASHDPLTALINRREFEARVEQALENSVQDNAEHALCFMDLDQFKVVNDTCGHIAGDELLKQLAAVLLDKIRDTDTLARLGGDEFGLLLLGCPLSRASEIAESLRNAVRDYRFVWEDKVFEIGVSIGVVGITAESGSLSDVLSAADLACYVAKDHGRNRVHVLDEDDVAAAQQHGHMQWLQRIQRALEEERFELYFQPIRALSRNGYGALHGEVLLRMQETEGGLISPAEFIPAAERYHLMPDIDRWVVRHAIGLIRHCRDKHNPQQGLCSINLSGQSLCDAEFLAFVVGELEHSGIPPQCLCFEITETAAIANFMYAERFINVLKGMGCRFALDDFGSGLSSFAYLKQLPVDFLKIDGSFVRGVIDDDIDAAMVASINQIGHFMGMQTVAEFVENPQIEAKVSGLGVDFAQGYAIGHPQPFAVYCRQLLQSDS